MGPTALIQVWYVILKFQSSTHSQRKYGIQHTAGFLYLLFVEFLNVTDFVLWAEFNNAAICEYQWDVSEKYKTYSTTHTHEAFSPLLLWTQRDRVWTVWCNHLKMLVNMFLFGLKDLCYMQVECQNIFTGIFIPEILRKFKSFTNFL